jgi:hypothetical protein
MKHARAIKITAGYSVVAETGPSVSTLLRNNITTCGLERTVVALELVESVVSSLITR